MVWLLPIFCDHFFLLFKTIEKNAKAPPGWKEILILLNQYVDGFQVFGFKLQ